MRYLFLALMALSLGCSDKATSTQPETALPAAATLPNVNEIKWTDGGFYWPGVARADRSALTAVWDIYLVGEFSVLAFQNAGVISINGNQIIKGRQGGVTKADSIADAPTRAEFNSLVARFNLLCDALDPTGHGLIDATER